MRLFVDTNWFLDLYVFPVKTLDELARLEAVKEHLVFDRQCRLEFYRRRENQINKVIGIFKEPGFTEAPCLMSRTAWEAARDAKKGFDKTREAVIKELELAREDIRADQIGRRFFALSQTINDAPVTDEIMARAESRKRRGDPPKSDGPTMGDEIHWEALVEWTVQQGKDAHHLAILTRDKGFLDSEQFLREEFRERASRDVIIAPELAVLLDAINTSEATSLPTDRVCHCGGVIRLFPSMKPTTLGISRLCHGCGQTGGDDGLPY